MIAAPPPSHLIDPDQAAALFVGAGLHVVTATPDYVRHKPGETTIVSYRFEIGDGTPERGYAHWCADPERADEVEHKAATLRPTTTRLGTATRRLDPNTVFYPFPNDARLRRLRWYTTPRKLKRTLAALAPGGAPLSGSRSTVEVLRYKPERRVVARAALSTADGAVWPVLVRYATARQADSLAAAALSLRCHGVDTPRPLLQLEGGRVSVDEFIDGIELRSTVRDRSDRPASDMIAEAIDRFHRAPVAAPQRTPLDDLDAAYSGLAALHTWDGDLAEPAEAARRELARTLPDDTSDPVLLHGDLHDNNLMATPHGGVAFVDLERLARGPAAVDLGRLRGFAQGMAVRQPSGSSHSLAQVEGVVERYRSGRRERISDRALGWHTATALVDQALLVARHLEPGWRHNAATLLERAIDQLTPIPTR